MMAPSPEAVYKLTPKHHWAFKNHFLTGTGLAWQRRDDATDISAAGPRFIEQRG